MENQEHLDILKQGVLEWNNWRAENPESRPDLSAANLRGANMRAAHLNWADLSAAYLRGADFHLANLGRPDLSAANLGGADLSAADLRGAKVSAEQLADCAFLVCAKMPDGNRYDGRFNFKGDIEQVREDGVDTDDFEVMARWYAGDD